MNKPFYFFKFQVYGCAFDLSVNDIYLMKNDEGDPISSKLPINAYLYNGNNQVKIKLRPANQDLALDERCKCTISIYYNENNDSKSPRVEVFSFTAPKFDSSDPKSSFEQASNIDIKIPFPSPIWTKSVSLKTIGNIKSQLIEEYKILYSFFEKKDIAGILDKLSFRKEEIGIALYMSANEIDEGIKSALELNFSSPGWVFEKFNEKNLEVKFAADGKLCFLENENGNSPIFFTDKDNGLVSTFQFYFCMHPTRNKLVIIR